MVDPISPSELKRFIEQPLPDCIVQAINHLLCQQDSCDDILLDFVSISDAAEELDVYDARYEYYGLNAKLAAVADIFGQVGWKVTYDPNGRIPSWRFQS